MSRKRVQFAHIDRDPSNSTAENLAPLCLDHHDEYDSRPSQSKGITQHELRSYKDQLINQIADGTLSLDGKTALRTIEPDRLPDSRDLRAYGSLFAEISRIFYAYDPIGIGYHGNLDEYEPEAHDLIMQLQARGGQLDFAKTCRQVIAKWFTKDLAEEFTEYRMMAQEIERAWRRYENLRTVFSDDEPW